MRAGAALSPWLQWRPAAFQQPQRSTFVPSCFSPFAPCSLLSQMHGGRRPSSSSSRSGLRFVACLSLSSDGPLPRVLFPWMCIHSAEGSCLYFLLLVFSFSFACVIE